jgi:peptidyl-prolyl cis-trans isomerase C
MTPFPAFTRFGLSLVLFGVVACHGSSGGKPLATVGDDVLVTTADLEAELRNVSPTIPSGKIDEAAKKELLDKLVRFALLSREAAREGLDKDDEVQRQLKKSMLNRFVGHQLDKDKRNGVTTDDELRAYYEHHKAEYVKPARLRLLVIVFGASDAGSAPPAAAVHAAADLKGASASAFSARARDISVDERTRNRGGGTDWMTRDELAARYGESVAAIALSLPPNQSSDPVAGNDGWYVVRVDGHQDPQNPSFEQLKQILKVRVMHDRRAEVAQAYEDELRKRSPVKIHDDVLAKVDPLHLPEEPGQGGVPTPTATPTPSSTAKSTPTATP